MNDALCPTSPYQRRNYRGGTARSSDNPAGRKCVPYTLTQAGLVKNGTVAQTGDSVESAPDAAVSPTPGGAGCVSCS